MYISHVEELHRKPLIEEVKEVFYDLLILTNRYLSNTFYSDNTMHQLTSKEKRREHIASNYDRWFLTEEKFAEFSLNHKGPLGRVIIGNGPSAILIDDTHYDGTCNDLDDLPSYPKTNSIDGLFAR